MARQPQNRTPARLVSDETSVSVGQAPDRLIQLEIALQEVSGEANEKGPELTGENRNSGPDQNMYATRAYPPSHGAVETRIDMLTVD